MYLNLAVGAEFAGPENDGPYRRAGKCKTWKLTNQHILEHSRPI